MGRFTQSPDDGSLGAQSLQHALRFVPGFFKFALGIGIGDDAAADGNLPPAARRSDRADEDARVQLVADADVSERTAVRATDGGLELRDDLHGANFGDAGHRTAGERVAQEMKRAHVGAECPFDYGDEMLHPGILLERTKLRDTDAAGLACAGEIVTQEVDDHYVLGAVFGGDRELLAGGAIEGGIASAGGGAFDGARFDMAVGDAEEAFGRSTRNLPAAGIEVAGHRRGVAFA